MAKFTDIINEVLLTEMASQDWLPAICSLVTRNPAATEKEIEDILQRNDKFKNTTDIDSQIKDAIETKQIRAAWQVAGITIRGLEAIVKWEASSGKTINSIIEKVSAVKKTNKDPTDIETRGRSSRVVVEKDAEGKVVKKTEGMSNDREVISDADRDELADLIEIKNFFDVIKGSKSWKLASVADKNRVSPDDISVKEEGTLRKELEHYQNVIDQINDLELSAERLNAIFNKPKEERTEEDKKFMVEYMKLKAAAGGIVKKYSINKGEGGRKLTMTRPDGTKFTISIEGRVGADKLTKSVEGKNNNERSSSVDEKNKEKALEQKAKNMLSVAKGNDKQEEVNNEKLGNYNGMFTRIKEIMDDEAFDTTAVDEEEFDMLKSVMAKYNFGDTNLKLNQNIKAFDSVVDYKKCSGKTFRLALITYLNSASMRAKADPSLAPKALSLGKEIMNHIDNPPVKKKAIVEGTKLTERQEILHILKNL